MVVDWDLEAPGIERYFSKFKIDAVSEGLLQLLLSFENDNEPDYLNYLWKIDTGAYSFSLIQSGRDKDSSKYSNSLQTFNWNDFFKQKNGGLFLERLRNKWIDEFDFVLIDSRTGLSDSSGICTILMPDILIPMFTANYQSLFGIRDIVKYIQSARQSLEVDRMSLTILPVPCRFGTRIEFRESQEWLERIADILGDCFSDWLPKWIEPKHILEQIKIPQIDYFSFGEKLAVIEQGTSDPDGMGYIFSKIASFLASDFTDIENFVGQEYYQSRKKLYESEKTYTNKSEESEFLYDVYIDYPREIYPWVKELLVPTLTEYLTDELNYKPIVYSGIGEISLSSPWVAEIETAINKSKIFVFIFTDSYKDAHYISLPLHLISQREKKNNQKIIFPIIYSQLEFDFSQFPKEFSERKFIDLSSYNFEETVRSTKLRAQFGMEIEQLSSEIAYSLSQKTDPDKKAKINKNNEQDERIEELLLLANEYDKLRKEIPSGINRTLLMENIVTSMKSVMNNPLSNLDKWTKSTSAGQRLIAIANLQKYPNLDYLSWLADHVGYSEKPFIGYHSSVAIFTFSRAFGKKHKNLLEEAIHQAQQNIERSDYKDPNQMSALNSAIHQLTIV